METTAYTWGRRISATLIYILLVAIAFGLTGFVFDTWRTDDWGIIGRFIFVLIGLGLIIMVVDGAADEDDDADEE